MAASRRLWSVRLVATWLSLIAGVTACGGAEIPEAPNLDRLDAIYRSPPGSVSAIELEVLVEVAQRELELVRVLGRADDVVRLLEDVSRSVQKISLDEDGEPIELRGGAKANRQCEGWSDEDRQSGDAGQLELTLPIEDSKLKKVVFGNLDGCRFQGDRGPASLTASTALSLGRDVPLVDLKFDRFVLVTLKGELGRPDGEQPLDVDFRVDSGAFTEVRVPAEGGDVVVGSDADERALLVRAANGTFCCYPAARACHDLTRASCPDAAEGEPVLEW